jgi:hypothetical protein
MAPEDEVIGFDSDLLVREKKGKKLDHARKVSCRKIIVVDKFSVHELRGSSASACEDEKIRD